MSANDNKRYYWLKLKKDFFQQHQIKVLKSLPNGRLYALIYLELLAESTSHEGELRYSQMIPYDVITLASVIDEDKDNVEKAIETLTNLELVEILEDHTIYMREINRLIGSETGKAIRMRNYRDKKQIGSNEPKCNLEYRDKSIENRVKDIFIIIKNRYIEAGYKKEILDRFESMMIKAIKQVNYVPTKERIEELTAFLIDDNDISNTMGYIVTCLENERSNNG